MGSVTRRQVVIACLVGLIGLGSGDPLWADSVLHLSLVTDEVELPVYATSPPGDSRRLFIVEQKDSDDSGWIWVVEDGELLAAPFLEVSPIQRVGPTGLLCLAFDPDYAGNGWFYVIYTEPEGHVVISRFSVSGDPDVADPLSERAILVIPQPHHFHDGGWLGFGPDGYLYVSSGDGGPGNDPNRYGRNSPGAPA